MLLLRFFPVLTTLILRGGGAAIAVLFAVMVSRYLPTSSAADFFLLFNVSTIAAVCFRWGLDEVIIRSVANLPLGEVSPVARCLMGLACRRVVTWFAVCFLGALFFHPLLGERVFEAIDLVAALGAAAFVALSACIARILQGEGRTNLATFLLNIIVPGLSLAGLLALVAIKDVGTRDLIFLYIFISFVVCSFTVARYFGNPLALFVVAFKSSCVNSYSCAANKLGVVVLTQQLLGWSALLIVPYSYGDEAYKTFFVLQKVATLISLTMLAINFTFSRRFATLYAHGDFKSLRSLLCYSLLAIIFASFAISLFLVLARHWLFSYAQIDPDMSRLLVFLLLGQFFFSVSALFSMLLSMAHDDNYLFVSQAIINGIGTVCLIVGCYFFSLDVLSALLGGVYFILSLSLGFRAYRLTEAAAQGARG